MKKILVPIDGSDISLKAADEAIELAMKFGSEVTFFSVAELKAPFYATGEVPTNSLEILKILEENASAEFETLLDSLLEKYKSSGLVLKKKVLTGIVADEIEAFAEEGKFDLIVMGRRGLSAVRRLFIGSNTRKIIAIAPCSVLVVKE
ncbi:universal stress protein [Acetobacterium bakii]|uniref:UspA domain-containing protein n=1 Tax=Acetobacterium bakii TaxID=52689 RepID=A0A0L6TZ89_9FIRM|nr:universal stress protein [Acetobacterium bakii]KNZ40865.1 hypothetical protein AKG39_14945 [Acetobacterium bakii]